MKKCLIALVLGTSAALGLMATPNVARAESCHASYRWEYRIVGYKCVSYTAYDHCGYPYTAHKYVPVYGWVKVYGH